YTTQIDPVDQRLAHHGAVTRNQFADFPDNLKNGANANRQKNRRQYRIKGKAADPSPNYRRAAGEQDQLGEVPQAGILADDGGGNTNTFGYVVQGKAQNQKSAQRRLTLSESSPNRQPFAQIVQPDPQRNPIGNAQRRDLTILAN